MAEIRVTAAELRTKAGELRGLNGQFKGQVGNLDSQEQSLGSMWEGEAKTAFHEAFTHDKEQMEEFYTLIEKYCQALEEIATKYEQAEMNNYNTAAARNY